MGGFSFLFALIVAVSSHGLGSNQSRVDFMVGNLTVVSVSDTSFALSWYSANPTQLFDHGRERPVPADTVVRYGTSADPSTWATIEVPGDTPYHHVELTGLDPDTTYHFEASSNGILATNIWPGMTRRARSWVHTLARPPGEHVARLALANDLHFGEQRSGILVNNFPPFFTVDPANPYWRFMSEAVIADASEQGADAFVASGDLTNEAEPDALAEVRELLDLFPGTTLVGRGNHDRAHQGLLYETCSPVPADATYFDCFADVFPNAAPGEAQNTAIDLAALRLVMLDSSDVLTGSGHVADETAAFLEAELDAAGDRPVLVFAHHPVTYESIRTWFPWPGFMLDAGSLDRLNPVVAEADNVLGFYTGHTHRNFRSRGVNPDIIFQEVGAAKEHIGGYALVDIYEGGLVHSFRMADCDRCREWSERTRHQYFGLYPWAVQGDLDDRAFTATFARPIGDGGVLGSRVGDLEIVGPSTASAPPDQAPVP